MSLWNTPAGRPWNPLADKGAAALLARLTPEKLAEARAEIERAQAEPIAPMGSPLSAADRTEILP